MSIVYGNYTPPPPPEPSKEEVNIRIGVFFDGTSNNRTNTNARVAPKEQKEKDAYKKYGGGDSSYENDLSNVARLEPFYKETDAYTTKVYIEGIGTEDLKDDQVYFSSKGVSMGTGPTGVRAKVRKGCEKVVKKINHLKKLKKINTLTLDVYGFSRGSAAARNFVHEVTKGSYLPIPVNTNNETHGSTESYTDYDGFSTKRRTIFPARGHLGLKLEELKIEIDRVVVRFVGLYDTVSSYDPTNPTYGPNFKNDVKELDLNSISRAKRIVHLIAEDEHRENFMVTSIKAALRVKVATGNEYVLPGVHSDIGGSYVHGKGEEIQLMDFDNTIGDGYDDEEYDKILMNDRNHLIEQGWFTPDEVSKKPNTWHETFATRKSISNRYSYVTLHILSELGNKNYADMFVMENILSEYKLPNGTENKYFTVDLNLVKKRLLDYIEGQKPPMKYYTNKELKNKKELLDKGKITTEQYNIMVNDHNMLMKLRNRYFHFSARTGEIGYEPHYKFKDKYHIMRLRETAKGSE
ncbi:DUF2235 domain-containing protein [Flavobacterium oreochromis]|uniref:T6SS phospholipase effector Tle1-like catalytic domain-containing protein n=1 Tax=Flavobacterium oreochromis TaxID=2906078 RepID=UPI0038584520